ncbi:MAG: NUDIX domain-containing protein [Clostridia bacterium]
MRLLANIDTKNYNPDWERIKRNAVRAIIPAFGDSLAMVRSAVSGYYKFPGGGIEAKETHKTALLRETREETGLLIDPESVREFGMVYEIRRSNQAKNQIFEQFSYYYFAELTGESVATNLDDYEKALGYDLRYISPKRAYEFNKKMVQNGGASFLPRETLVLSFLLSEKGAL